jgi:hypothetical protein
VIHVQNTCFWFHFTTWYIAVTWDEQPRPDIRTYSFFVLKTPELKWRAILTINDIFFKSLCVLTIDLHLHLLYRKCIIQFALKAPPIICMSRREMDDVCLSCRTPSSFDVSTLSGSTEFCVWATGMPVTFVSKLDILLTL